LEKLYAEGGIPDGAAALDFKLGPVDLGRPAAWKHYLNHPPGSVGVQAICGTIINVPSVPLEKSFGRPCPDCVRILGRTW
jgi:hypothetical protein